MDVATGLFYLREFIDKVGGEFMAENVREWSEAAGCPVAIQPRVWGSVITAAKKSNMIRHVRYARTSNPKAHKTPASVWCGIYPVI